VVIRRNININYYKLLLYNYLGENVIKGFHIDMDIFKIDSLTIKIKYKVKFIYTETILYAIKF